MKWNGRLLFMLVAAFAAGQAAPDMAHESHHSLLFENSQVRVFSLQLGYNESELTLHDHAFLLVTLADCQPAMWLEGQSPIISGTLKQGWVNYVPGGWTRGMRNDQKSTCRFIVVEFLDPRAMMNEDVGYAGSTGPSQDPAAKSIATMPLGTSYVTAAYLPHGESIPARPEDIGELLVAITDLDLKILKTQDLKTEDAKGDDDHHIRKSPGELEWLEPGRGSAWESEGSAPARFVLVRFLADEK
ncbi:MAG TPA: hypothetical protein VKR60_06365 [Candidatus Sulfotelmatobacter sp.]|nr:hypothetical protein [Candidatus Sulfotelmatobacter sp.]